MLTRDWRGGELQLLAVALLIAVTSVSAVGFFVDRAERGLARQAAALIAADLVVSSAAPLSPAFAQQARAQGLATAQIRQLRSVALAGERLQLVEVKAVSPGYPLRGELRTAPQAYAPDRPAAGIPPRGEAWVQPRLLQALGLEVGDSFQLGEQPLRIGRILSVEPDPGGDMFSVAPRVLINLDDLPATGLLGQGALVNYRLLIAGEAAAVQTSRANLALQLRGGEKLLQARDGRPELRSALERAQRFLSLAALVSVLLAGVAVATAARRFARRHFDTSAILRCLGATQGRIARAFGLEMLWLALLASTAGVLLGVAAQALIARLLERLLLVPLPPPSWQPLLPGYATGLLLLLGFALPPLLALRQVPPLRVLRRDVPVRAARGWPLYAAMLVAMGVLSYWQLGDARLVLTVFAGMLASVALLALAARLLILLLGRLRGRVGVAWRFGLANIARRPGASVVQLVAIGLGLTVLLLLSTVRNDLLRDWRRSLPPQAPNHFLINVQPDQVAGIRAFFADQGVARPVLHPMVRARLVSLNGKPVSSHDYAGERAKHLVTREFNLSWAARPQADNRIVAGRWWSPDEQGQAQLSLEAGLAETLGIALHDRVGFRVNGRVREFRVTSLRQVDWDSFNVNFFTLVPPGVLAGEPASYVTSLYLAAADKPRLAALVQQFPNVTVIDIDAVLTGVRRLIGQVTRAVEFLFLFTLAAGVAVLYAAIQTHRDERRYESALLRTLGARRGVLLRGLLAEFLTLGALAGLLAGLAASALAWALAAQVFHFAYRFDPAVVAWGVLAGVLLVGAAGWLGTRRALNQAPARSLREAL